MTDIVAAASGVEAASEAQPLTSHTVLSGIFGIDAIGDVGVAEAQALSVFSDLTEIVGVETVAAIGTATASAGTFDETAAARRRRAWLGLGRAPSTTLPTPDGTISAEDRALLVASFVPNGGWPAIDMQLGRRSLVERHAISTRPVDRAGR